MTTTTTRPARWLMDEAHGWCADCFEDYPEDASDAEALACVRRQYEGGLAQFVADIS